MNFRETLRARPSICDPPAGLTAASMEETLEREIRRAGRSKRPLAVIMLDVDNFKDFNDSFGHKVVRVALQNLCQMLRTHIRSEDATCGLWRR